jgi:hypothetical protein
LIRGSQGGELCNWIHLNEACCLTRELYIRKLVQ